jgi:hypothetical protein
LRKTLQGGGESGFRQVADRLIRPGASATRHGHPSQLFVTLLTRGKPADGLHLTNARRDGCTSPYPRMPCTVP